MSRIMSRFVPVTCPSVSGLGRLSLFQSRSSIPSHLVPLSWCQPFPGGGPLLVPALLRCQHCSGSCTALVRGNANEYKLWRPFGLRFWYPQSPGIRKVLVSAKPWCQQSPDVSKALRLYFFSRYISSPVTLLLPSHLLSCLSRHPSSPVTLLLPSPFFSRHPPPATFSLLLLSLSYHSFSCVPEWIIKGLERSRRSALANFGGVDRSQGETVLHDL
jgi:hypothetical protein